MNVPCSVSQAAGNIQSVFSFWRANDFIPKKELNVTTKAWPHCWIENKCKPQNFSSADGIFFEVLSSTHDISKKNNYFHKSYNKMDDSFGCYIILCYDAEREVSAMREDASIARLDEIATLQDDWNGYGAKQFSMALIEKCKNIVRNLSIAPEVYPTGRQSIQFQYELEDRSYLEFEIFEEKSAYLQVPKRKYADAIMGQFSEREIDRIKEIVGDFYGQGNQTH